MTNRMLSFVCTIIRRNRNMSYNIWLWLAFLLYILYMPTCVVGGLIIQEAVPGQNISLPCMGDQVNNQQTVKWWSRNVYISSEKNISGVLGNFKAFYALPGVGANYSLFIIIPDKITIWPHLAETYECRLVPGNNEEFTKKKSYKLQIYQPECTIIHINGNTSVASCSYQNIQEFQVELLVDGSSVHSMGDCTSDVCTLNYTYKLREDPQGVECKVSISNNKHWRIKCSVKNSQDTVTHLTSINGGISLNMTTTHAENTTKSSSIMTTATLGSTAITTMTSKIPVDTVISSTMSTNQDGTATIMTTAYPATIGSIAITTMTSKIPEDTVISSTLSTNQDGTATIMTKYPEEIAISPSKSTTKDITIYLIVISVAASIILFLICIFIVCFIRRSFKEKQNPSMNSPATNEKKYEIDKKSIGMMERPAQKDDINFKQSPADSEMEENCIYQSADTNADEQNGIINKDKVGMPHKEKIHPDYLDQTNSVYEEIDDIIDDININKNKKSGGQNTLQMCNKVETSNDFQYIENEAYQSLDEVNECIWNAGWGKASERMQAMKQNVVKPAYVHYEVLERE